MARAHGVALLGEEPQDRGVAAESLHDAEEGHLVPKAAPQLHPQHLLVERLRAVQVADAQHYFAQRPDGEGARRAHGVM